MWRNYIIIVFSAAGVLGGADSSAMMMCSDTVGTLNSLDWCLLSTDAPEQRLSLDGIKYAGSAPDITINHINASDEGLYICHFDIVGSGVGQKDAGCLYVLGELKLMDNFYLNSSKQLL